MNTNRNRLTGLFSLLVITLAASARCQIYSFSSAVTVTPLPIHDSGLALDGLSIGNATLTENAIINSATPSIEQKGSLVLPASTLNETFNETKTITLPPVFPNPPQTLTLTGSLTLNVSFAGGTFSFDTGPSPLNFVSPNNYSFFESAAVVLPLDFSYSLVTGGQTYTGSSVVDVAMGLKMDGELDTSSYPGSIGLDINPSLTPPPGIIPVATIDAANGFDSMIAVTPEPSTLGLGAMGVIAMLVFRRRARNHCENPAQANVCSASRCRTAIPWVDAPGSGRGLR